MNTPLENVEALSRQTEIKYGPVKGGSTENFVINGIAYTFKSTLLINFTTANQNIYI